MKLFYWVLRILILFKTYFIYLMIAIIIFWSHFILMNLIWTIAWFAFIIFIMKFLRMLSEIHVQNFIIFLIVKMKFKFITLITLYVFIKFIIEINVVQTHSWIIANYHIFIKFKIIIFFHFLYYILKIREPL